MASKINTRKGKGLEIQVSLTSNKQTAPLTHLFPSCTGKIGESSAFLFPKEPLPISHPGYFRSQTVTRHSLIPCLCLPDFESRLVFLGALPRKRYKFHINVKQDCEAPPWSNKLAFLAEYSLEGLMLKLKLQDFGHLMWRPDSWEKTLMLGKIEGMRRGPQRIRWLDGITDSEDMSLSKS